MSSRGAAPPSQRGSWRAPSPSTARDRALATSTTARNAVALDGGEAADDENAEDLLWRWAFNDTELANDAAARARRAESQLVTTTAPTRRQLRTDQRAHSSAAIDARIAGDASRLRS